MGINKTGFNGGNRARRIEKPKEWDLQGLIKSFIVGNHYTPAIENS